MKITNKQLRQIIKEELDAVLNEQEHLNEALSNDIKDMAMQLGMLVATVGAGAAVIHADETGKKQANDQYRTQYEIGKHSVADMETGTKPDLSKVSAKNRYEVLKKSVEQTAAKNNMDEADVWLKVIHGAYEYSPDIVDRRLKNLQKDIDFDAKGKKFDMELDAAIKGLTYENKKRG